jgi:putative SOS response-associated peptidase YedK
VGKLRYTAPTRDAPVIRLSREGERHLDLLKWAWCPILAKRRCNVPAPVYYEKRDDPDGKTPFAVARADGDSVAFGGIWEEWRSRDGERLQAFATITTEANDLLVPIQDRMPVIIERADGLAWRRRGRSGGIASPHAQCRAAGLAGRQEGGQRAERQPGPDQAHC